MKSVLFLFCIFLLCSSCQWFETEKVTSDTFLEEELKTINWNDIDSYPLFESCDETAAKNEQISCFEETLTKHIYKNISNTSLKSNRTFSETITVHLIINNKGLISIDSITGNTMVFEEFPTLKSSLNNSINTLPKTAPALKRGIPVTTKFLLPVVITTE